jgi:hypothetical protein
VTPAAFARRRRAVLLGALLALGAPACTTLTVTTTEDSSIEQLLLTEAVDRTFDRLTWPDLAGKRAYPDVMPLEPEEQTLDERWYVLQELKTELAHRGAVLAEFANDADVRAVVMIGALGTEHQEQFLGVPASQSVIIPISIPELVIYKSIRLQGFAKLEVAILDAKKGEVLHRAGPARAQTFWRKRRIVVYSTERTDTSRYLLGASEFEP